MAYTKNTWLARVRQYANRITLTLVSGSTYDVTQVEGTITQAGLALNPTNLNKMEQGIADAHSMATIYMYKNVGGAL